MKFLWNMQSQGLVINDNEMNDWARIVKKRIENDDNSKSFRGGNNFEMIAANEIEKKSFGSSKNNNRNSEIDSIIQNFEKLQNTSIYEHRYIYEGKSKGNKKIKVVDYGLDGINTQL